MAQLCMFLLFGVWQLLVIICMCVYVALAAIPDANIISDVHITGIVSSRANQIIVIVCQTICCATGNLTGMSS